jgi:hypothetical protein
MSDLKAFNDEVGHGPTNVVQDLVQEAVGPVIRGPLAPAKPGPAVAHVVDDRRLSRALQRSGSLSAEVGPCR